MDLRAQELYMEEDDRYDRTCYSTYYTTSIITRVKNYLKTLYAHN